MLPKRIWLSLLLPLAIASAHAAERKADPKDPTENPVMLTAGFLSWHPDLRFRLHGLEALKESKPEDAMKFFQRASYYGDKPSQGMVAEMYWNGQGAPQDKAAAYAWMDLAAERGYAGFLGLRERYWAGLNEAERARALQVGEDLYVRYGDAVALRRIAAELRRGRKHMAGSRTGFTGNMQIQVPGLGGYESISAKDFFDDQYWDPEKYQQWHTAIWSKPRVGRVSVGDVEQVNQVQSRIPTPSRMEDTPEPTSPEPNDDVLTDQPDKP